MSFLEQLHKDTNKYVLTENGAVTYASTLDPVLDFFSLAGAKRGREAEALALFNKAFAAEPQLAIRCLFYLRDVRGGQGERSVFRYIFNHLPDAVKAKVSEHIEQYGRWDDVEIADYNYPMIASQILEDVDNSNQGKSISLLAKWLPSANASSKESRRQALALAKGLGFKESQYRKVVSGLRKHLNLLESQMSAKEWSDIDYEKLPSQAHRKHVKAFVRNDKSRYEEYLASVEKGEKKINSNTSYTYEIFEMLYPSLGYGHSIESDETVVKAANAMWAALPDYTNGANALVLPDVSGSMYGRPIAISVSLATYFAERNTGMFKDYFLEFSSRAVLHKLHGSTLSAKLQSVVSSTNWMGSTNLQSAFDAILDALVKQGATQEEAPRVLYIISDMEFNQATDANTETNYEAAKRKFEQAGYTIPHVVFWNVNARSNQAPATKYDNGITLISGSSQSTFKYAVAGKTPVETMLEVLDSERYAKIIYTN